MLIAEKRKEARIVSYEQRKGQLICTTENGMISIEAMNDHILKIQYTLDDTFPDKVNLAVTGEFLGCTFIIQEDENYLQLKTQQLMLVISKATSAFSYYDTNGTLLVKEPQQGGKHLIPFESYRTMIDHDSTVEKVVTPDGIKSVVKEAKKVFDRTLYHTRLEFEWADGEALYGLGQQEEGTLNLRNTRQYIHQANMKIAIPLLVSSRGYGVLIDTYSPMIFNDNEYGSYLYNEAAEALEYYFIYGENLDGVVKGYRQLTGKATMLPKWAFGFMQSQERFESQQEIKDVVLEYRRRNLPLDSIVLDWCSWEEGMWGQKTFDTTRFPDALGMTDWLHSQGVHFMISIWPNMNTTTDNYREMQDNKSLFQQSEIYNAFDADARKLYWKQANEGLFSKGVDAWWCDSSEPVTPEWNCTIKPEPDQNYMAFHQSAKMYMDEAYTNAYPLLHAKTMYDGQREVTEAKRVVNLTRSAYTGSQKFGTILWSGDISAKWSTLASQIAAGLNFCASGMPYWTLDIGAFFVKKGHMWFWDGDYEAGCDDLGYRELYTRWFQLGAFLPIFRAHGTDTRREIWQFGDKGTVFYDALEAYDALRYQFLPYIYSMAGRVTQDDYTIMRLLAFDFSHDAKVLDIQDQYMFGDSLMVCPVTFPMYFTAGSKLLADREKVRTVYLPKGTTWIDYWTNHIYEGGQYITTDALLETLPLFVKGGSIIPMGEVVCCSEQSSDKAIKLMIYPGADATFTLYQDENDTYNYEKGAFSTITIAWDDITSTLTLDTRSGTFIGIEEELELSIYCRGEFVKQVRYVGTMCIVQL